jgi:hypothetical protein
MRSIDGDPKQEAKLGKGTNVLQIQEVINFIGV